MHYSDSVSRRYSSLGAQATATARRTIGGRTLFAVVPASKDHGTLTARASRLQHRTHHVCTPRRDCARAASAAPGRWPAPPECPDAYWRPLRRVRSKELAVVPVSEVRRSITAESSRLQHRTHHVCTPCRAPVVSATRKRYLRHFAREAKRELKLFLFQFVDAR